MKFQDLEHYLVANGTMQKKELEQAYESAQSVEEMVPHITRFDLKESLEVYRRTGHLLSFEIGMNNHILNKGLDVLKPTILSFGTMLAYIYLKELEVRTLRIAINSKIYGLAPGGRCEADSMEKVTELLQDCRHGEPLPGAGLQDRRHNHIATRPRPGPRPSR